MPPPRRTRKKFIRRFKKKARMMRSVAPREEVCRIKETLPAQGLEANTPYMAQTNLSNFPRALDIADNFQLYRITKVEYKYTPNYDTFAANYQPGTSNVSMTVPYLYSQRLTYDSPATWNLSFLQTMGARPRRLDDKTLNVTYRPNVNIQLANSTGQQAAKPNYSPWLSTHFDNGSPPVITMDDTTHWGHAFWIAQTQGTLDMKSVASVEIVVHFEFKKPWDKSLASTTGPNVVRVGKAQK